LNNGDDSSSLRHWLMHSIAGILGNLNYRSSSYSGMCTAMQSIVFVVVVVAVVNVMEVLRFVVADDFGRCEKLSTHAVFV
jgi:hypothetical protein